MMTFSITVMFLAGLAYWLLLKVRYRFRDYTYKYEYKGGNAISKYKLVVYYKDEIIHTNNYCDTSLLGGMHLTVQALSHQRRKAINE